MQFFCKTEQRSYENNLIYSIFCYIKRIIRLFYVKKVIKINKYRIRIEILGRIRYNTEKKIERETGNEVYCPAFKNRNQ